MSNLHRITWIDTCIREGRYPNSRTIAGHFEISQRQAQRDIEYLRDTMGAPAAYSASKNGYYYTDRTFALPSVFMTGSDRAYLSYLAGQYSMAAGEGAMQLAGLFKRLSGEEEEEGKVKKEGDKTCNPDLPVFDIDKTDVAVFNLLLKASKNHIKVKITYMKFSSEKSIRVIHPYKLFNKNRIDYVAAFCELRNEIRVFRLSRITEPALLQAGFEVSLQFREDDYGPSIGFKYREPYQALIEFDTSPDPGTFKLSLAPESYGLYNVSFDSSDEILTALLSCKSDFKIHRPNWLKDKLKSRLEKILGRNF